MSLVGCFALTAYLVSLGLPSGSDAEPAAARQGGSSLAPAPQLERDSGTDGTVEEGPSGFGLVLVWFGAMAAGSGTVVAFIVFRVEVRREKDARRAARHREEYRKDMRRYNAQMRGPRGDNT